MADRWVVGEGGADVVYSVTTSASSPGLLSLRRYLGGLENHIVDLVAGGKEYPQDLWVRKGAFDLVVLCTVLTPPKHAVDLISMPGSRRYNLPRLHFVEHTLFVHHLDLTTSSS